MFDYEVAIKSHFKELELRRYSPFLFGVTATRNYVLEPKDYEEIETGFWVADVKPFQHITICPPGDLNPDLFVRTEILHYKEETVTVKMYNFSNKRQELSQDDEIALFYFSSDKILFDEGITVNDWEKNW